MDILHFIFEDGWHFVGTLFLIAFIACCIEWHLTDPKRNKKK